MTTSEGRPNTALLVVDTQNAILAAAAGRDGVVANIGGLVAKARAEGVPVIWIQHSGDGLPLGSAGSFSPST
jgi:nicotinamidase-related amidase